jgi:hypothetical protein
VEQDDKNTVFGGLTLIDNCKRDVLRMKAAFQLVDESGIGKKINILECCLYDNQSIRPNRQS